VRRSIEGPAPIEPPPSSPAATTVTTTTATTTTTTTTATTPEPVEPAPFSPDPVDDGTTQGAVAIPFDARGLDFLDTSVSLEELPTIGARWQKRERVRYKGRVPVALHSFGHRKLALSFVAPVDITVSDYPGTLKTIELLSSDSSNVNGNAFGPLRWEARGKNESGSLGPIHAAIRVKPLHDAPESERRQVVVYVPPKSKVVLVATKLVTDTTWTPLLRVDTPNATRIDLIDPGWH
jgi:hypothetical protein